MGTSGSTLVQGSLRSPQGTPKESPRCPQGDPKEREIPLPKKGENKNNVAKGDVFLVDFAKWETPLVIGGPGAICGGHGQPSGVPKKYPRSPMEHPRNPEESPRSSQGAPKETPRKGKGAKQKEKKETNSKAS